MGRPAFGRRPEDPDPLPGPFQPAPNYDPSPEASLAAPPNFSRRKSKKPLVTLRLTSRQFVSLPQTLIPARCAATAWARTRHLSRQQPAQQQHATSSSVLFRCWRALRSLHVSGSNRALADSSHSLSAPPPCGSVEFPNSLGSPSCSPPLRGPDGEAKGTSRKPRTSACMDCHAQGELAGTFFSSSLIYLPGAHWLSDATRRPRRDSGILSWKSPSPVNRPQCWR